MEDSSMDSLVIDLNDEIESDLHNMDYSSLVVGSRDWTVETIVDQIRKEHFDLNPAFQRRAAWNDEKRSRFIESLVLGVPIPQVVLAEDRNERGKFLVIDGKQRLLTVAGMFIDDFNFWKRREFVKLNELSYLNGRTLDDFMHLAELDGDCRVFANAPIRCSVLSGYKDVAILYDVFYRLNSGSVPLSGQELRQVFYRGKFAEYLFDITNREAPIHNVLGISEPDRRLADIEIILRFIAVASRISRYNGNLKDYLDITMSTITDEWAKRRDDVATLYAEFNSAISKLARLIGIRNVGRRATGGAFDARFNKAIFEIEVYFFQYIAEDGIERFSEAFQQRFFELCERPAFRESIEATTKSIQRFRTRFAAFRQLVDDVFGLQIHEFPDVDG